MVGKLDTKSVDKVVDTAPDYRVRAAVETQDRKGQGGEQPKREEDEYSVSSGAKEWLKFATAGSDRKTFKLRKIDIARLTLNQVFLKKGVVIIDTDLQLKNGMVLSEAHIYSTKMDLYWKLKNLKKGEGLSIDDIVTQPHLEVSVPQKKAPPPTEGKAGKTIGSPHLITPQAGWALWPLWMRETRKVNWKAVTLYAAALLLLVTILIIL